MDPLTQEQGLFFDNINYNTAEKLLLIKGNVTGTFLIRAMGIPPAYYELLVRDGDVVKHYFIREESTTTIDNLQRYARDANGLQLYTHLMTPCPIRTPDGNEDWEFDWSTVKLKSKLCDGKFSEIWMGTWKNTIPVAVKTLRPGSVTVVDFMSEAQILMSLQHHKLIKVYGVYTQKYPFHIVTELMRHHDLLDYLRIGEGLHLVFPELMGIGAQVANGMAYLELKHYVHRNLCASNILVGERNIVKIGGFSLARILVDGKCSIRKEEIFPIKWTAPEVAFSGHFTDKSDIWSFGVFLSELITHGHNPYPKMTNDEVLKRVRQGYRMSPPPGCPDHLYQVMIECWKTDLEERPTFDHVIHKLKAVSLNNRYNPRAVQVVSEYEAKEPDELTIHVGDIIRNCKTIQKGRSEGELNGKIGQFSDDHIVMQEFALVKFEYKARESDELTIHVGNVIRHCRPSQYEGWLKGEINGKTGVFPSNFIVMKKNAIVQLNYGAMQPNELTIHVGETIHNCRSVKQGWSKGELNGKIGRFPDDHVVKIGNKGSVRVLSEYEAKKQDELTIYVGDIIRNCRLKRKGWLEGELNGKIGVFPCKHVVKLDVVGPVLGRFNYMAKSPHHLTFHAGDIIRNCGLLTKGMAEGELNGKIGLFPYKYVTKLFTVWVCFEFEAIRPEELTICVGDIIKNCQQVGKGWLKGELNGKLGVFPMDHVVNLAYDDLIILDSITREQNWFFGNINFSDAEDLFLLRGNMTGAFLVRTMMSYSSYHQLLVREDAIVRQYFIRKDLSTTVDHLQRYARGIYGQQLSIQLTTPCLVKVSDGNWETELTSIELRYKLYDGAFSVVAKGIWNDIIPIAVEIPKPSPVASSDFLTVAQVMKQLQHKKIIRLYAVCTQEQPFYILTELMTHGNLLDYLHKFRDKGQHLKLSELIDIGAQVANGMAYLESQHYIHNDLGARNVLVGDRNIVKIGGFHLARRLVNGRYSRQAEKFPVLWIAPEALLSNSLTSKSDVWSFGVFLTELVTHGCKPYSDWMTSEEVISQLTKGYRIPQSPKCPDRLYQIMLDCWMLEPEKRPTFEELDYKLIDYFVSINGRRYP